MNYPENHTYVDKKRGGFEESALLRRRVNKLSLISKFEFRRLEKILTKQLKLKLKEKELSSAEFGILRRMISGYASSHKIYTSGCPLSLVAFKLAGIDQN